MDEPRLGPDESLAKFSSKFEGARETPKFREIWGLLGVDHSVHPDNAHREGDFCEIETQIG
jgi:hypothetical protein